MNWKRKSKCVNPFDCERYKDALRPPEAGKSLRRAINLGPKSPYTAMRMCVCSSLCAFRSSLNNPSKHCFWFVFKSRVCALQCRGSVFPRRANLQRVSCLFPSLSSGTDDTLLVYTPMHLSHSHTEAFFAAAVFVLHSCRGTKSQIPGAHHEFRLALFLRPLEADERRDDSCSSAVVAAAAVV